mgnify:CR=1 FL=1
MNEENIDKSMRLVKKENRLENKGLKMIKIQIILKKIFQNIQKINTMRLLQHNKYYQNKINISL